MLMLDYELGKRGSKMLFDRGGPGKYLLSNWTDIFEYFKGICLQLLELWRRSRRKLWPLSHGPSFALILKNQAT